MGTFYSPLLLFLLNLLYTVIPVHYFDDLDFDSVVIQRERVAPEKGFRFVGIDKVDIVQSVRDIGRFHSVSWYIDILAFLAGANPRYNCKFVWVSDAHRILPLKFICEFRKYLFFFFFKQKTAYEMEL